MSPLTLGARDRRAIVLAVIVLVPLLAWTGVIRPYRAALADARAELAAERSLLADEQSLLAASERYPLAYRAADSALLRTTPRLFSEADDILATSQLASYIASNALSSHALLQEAVPQPTRRLPEGIRMLEVEIRAESDLEGVLRFLDALERGPKMVVVDNVSISREERTQDRGRPPMAVLTLSATIRGFALVETPSVASLTGDGGRPLGETP
jgi:hypothetical protein